MTVGSLITRFGVRGVDDVRKGANQVGRSLDRVSDAQENLRRTSGNATNIVTSFGDAIQDARFGIAGAANNLSFIVEGFGQLTTAAGGVTGALRSVGSALLGPAGLVLAFQAVFAFLPEISAALQSVDTSAGGLSAQLTALGTTLFPIRDELRQIGETIRSVFSGGFGLVGDAVRNALDNVLSVLTGSLQVIGQITEGFLNILTGDFSGAFQNIKNIVSTVLQVTVDIVAGNLDIILGLFQETFSGISDFLLQIASVEGLGAAGQLAGGLGSALAGSIEGGLQSARESVRSFEQSYTSQLDAVKAQTVSTASSIASALSGAFSSSADSAEEEFERIDISIERPEDVIGGERFVPEAVQGASADVTPLLTKQAQRLLEGNRILEQLGRIGQQAFGQLASGIASSLSVVKVFTGEIKSLGDVLTGVFKSVLSAIDSVVQKLASTALQAGLLSLLNIGTGGFGGIFTSLLGGGGIPGLNATAASSVTTGANIQVGGSFQLRGRDLVASVQQTQSRLNRR